MNTAYKWSLISSFDDLCNMHSNGIFNDKCISVPYAKYLDPDDMERVRKLDKDHSIITLCNQLHCKVEKQDMKITLRSFAVFIINPSYMSNLSEPELARKFIDYLSSHDIKFSIKLSDDETESNISDYNALIWKEIEHSDDNRKKIVHVPFDTNDMQFCAFDNMGIMDAASGLYRALDEAIFLFIYGNEQDSLDVLFEMLDNI